MGYQEWKRGLAQWAVCPNMGRTPEYKYWVPGDVDGFCALFFDNLATLILATTLLINATDSTMTPVVYQRILPGFGLSLLFGNTYYSWMAAKLAASDSRTDVTAQPYGINTPGAIAFVFSIMAPAYFDALGDGKSASEAVLAAWRIGVSANFVSGALEIVGSFMGNIISKYVPTAALLGGLSGIGFAFLAFSPLITSLGAEPLVTMLPFAIIIVGYFGQVKFGRVPIAFLAMLLGTIMSWILGRQGWSDVEDAADHVGKTGLYIPLKDIFMDLGQTSKYLSTIVPISIINFVGTIECTESAHRVGDGYDVTESMIADGVGTCIGAMFGSPFSTCVYVGHPAYKSMGAGRGYSVANGVCVALLCFTGLAAPLFAIISRESVQPVIIFVGLAVTCQAFENSPVRHYPAILVGLCPMLLDWAGDAGMGKCVNDPTSASIADGVVTLSRYAASDREPLLRGIMNIGRGGITTSMVMSALMVTLIDRDFLRAMAWSCIAVAFSMVGLIHNKNLGWHTRSSSDREVYFTPALTDTDGNVVVNAATLYAPDDGWQFASAYAMLAALAAALHFAQLRGWIEQARSDDSKARHRSSLNPTAVYHNQDSDRLANTLPDRAAEKSASVATAYAPPANNEPSSPAYGTMSTEGGLDAKLLSDSSK